MATSETIGTTAWGLGRAGCHCLHPDRAECRRKRTQFVGAVVRAVGQPCRCPCHGPDPETASATPNPRLKQGKTGPGR